MRERIAEMRESSPLSTLQVNCLYHCRVVHMHHGIEDADMFRRLSRIGRTMIDPKLEVQHSGRRGHQVGWVRLIAMWLINSVYFSVRNRALTKEWKPIR